MSNDAGKWLRKKLVIGALAMSFLVGNMTGATTVKADSLTENSPPVTAVMEAGLQADIAASTQSSISQSEAAEEQYLLVKGQKYKFPEGIWTSSDSSIVEIELNGMAKAKRAGQVTLYNQAFSMTVIVKDPHFEKKKIELIKG